MGLQAKELNKLIAVLAADRLVHVYVLLSGSLSTKRRFSDALCPDTARMPWSYECIGLCKYAWSVIITCCKRYICRDCIVDRRTRSWPGSAWNDTDTWKMLRDWHIVSFTCRHPAVSSLPGLTKFQGWQLLSWTSTAWFQKRFVYTHQRFLRACRFTLLLRSLTPWSSPISLMQNTEIRALILRWFLVKVSVGWMVRVLSSPSPSPLNRNWISDPFSCVSGWSLLPDSSRRGRLH